MDLEHFSRNVIIQQEKKNIIVTEAGAGSPAESSKFRKVLALKFKFFEDRFGYQRL